MTFELPSGLLKVIHELRRLIADPDVSVALSPVLFEAAKLLASIPDLVEEIGRLRERIANLESGLRGFESDCIELAAECEDADISPAERRTYRAFAASARAILAKTQEAAP